MELGSSVGRKTVQSEEGSISVGSNMEVSAGGNRDQITTSKEDLFNKSVDSWQAPSIVRIAEEGSPFTPGTPVYSTEHFVQHQKKHLSRGEKFLALLGRGGKENSVNFTNT